MRVLQSDSAWRRWRSVPLLMLVSVALAAGSGPARADDRILAQEVVPALRGRVEGLVELGQAPPPGASRMVRRGEVRRALRAAGYQARGLAIPRSVRIVRRARVVKGDELVELTRGALTRAVAPCELQQVAGPARVRVASGTLSVQARPAGTLRSGSRTVVTELHAGGRTQAVAMRVRLLCPPPAVRAGSRVRVVAVVGAVRATAQGEARQDGQVGEVVRVRNTTTGVTLSGVVVDESTVEVLQ